MHRYRWELTGLGLASVASLLSDLLGRGFVTNGFVSLGLFAVLLLLVRHAFAERRPLLTALWLLLLAGAVSNGLTQLAVAFFQDSLSSAQLGLALTPGSAITLLVTVALAGWLAPHGMRFSMLFVAVYLAPRDPLSLVSSILGVFRLEELSFAIGPLFVSVLSIIGFIFVVHAVRFGQEMPLRLLHRIIVLLLAVAVLRGVVAMLPIVVTALADQRWGDVFGILVVQQGVYIGQAAAILGLAWVVAMLRLRSLARMRSG